MYKFKIGDIVTTPLLKAPASVTELVEPNSYKLMFTEEQQLKFSIQEEKYLTMASGKPERLKELAEGVAKLVVEKQAAYGDSFGRSGNVLREMYPNGVEPRDFDEMLTIARILDKLFRIATDPNYGGESPYRDILGYSLLGLERHENK